MGIYEFLCPNQHITEKMVPMNERDRPVTCDHCKEMATHVLSATPTTFRAQDRKAFKRTGR